MNESDRVILFDPSYYHYKFNVSLNRGRILWLPIVFDGGMARFDQDLLKRHMAKAKMIFLNNPSNPTGTIMAREDLELIIELANRHDVLIVSDDVYEKFQSRVHLSRPRQWKPPGPEPSLSGVMQSPMPWQQAASDMFAHPSIC